MFTSVKFSFCFVTLASATDGTKLLVNSVCERQRQNPCSGYPLYTGI